jgi:hypothetical protein
MLQTILSSTTIRLTIKPLSAAAAAPVSAVFGVFGAPAG